MHDAPTLEVALLIGCIDSDPIGHAMSYFDRLLSSVTVRCREANETALLMTAQNGQVKPRKSRRRF
jgi:hypothetical protein